MAKYVKSLQQFNEVKNRAYVLYILCQAVTSLVHFVWWLIASI